TLDGVLQFDIFSNSTSGASYSAPAVALTKYVTSSNDLLKFTSAGSLSVTGEIQVADASSIASTFVKGDTWLLADWNGLTHSVAFTTITALPTLGSGLAWDIQSSQTNFNTYGTITVVPEPSRAVLMLFGVAALVMRRRRTSAR
ncbi:MAG: PEP-CTERM sorting domain-containing protein, partial [Verrucomicrobiaceae bacterium]